MVTLTRVCPLKDLVVFMFFGVVNTAQQACGIVCQLETVNHWTCHILLCSILLCNILLCNMSLTAGLC